MCEGFGVLRWRIVGFIVATVGLLALLCGFDRGNEVIAMEHGMMDGTILCSASKV